MNKTITQNWDQISHQPQSPISFYISDLLTRNQFKPSYRKVPSCNNWTDSEAGNFGFKVELQRASFNSLWKLYMKRSHPLRGKKRVEGLKTKPKQTKKHKQPSPSCHMFLHYHTTGAPETQITDTWAYCTEWQISATLCQDTASAIFSTDQSKRNPETEMAGEACPILRFAQK